MYLFTRGVLLCAVVTGCAGAESKEESNEESSADEINSAAGACGFTNTASGDNRNIRVAQFNGGEVSHAFDFDLPTKDLPLREGFEKKIDSWAEGDWDEFKYSGGELKITMKQGTNFTTDTVVMIIDPNLTHPGKVTYERKADWWVRPLVHTERFSCETWKSD